MPQSLKKKYNSYYFTIKSPLFTPFNTLNLFVHFQHEEINNSTDGYYLLNAIEQCNSGDAVDNYCHGSKKQNMDKNQIKPNYIKKIASA